MQANALAQSRHPVDHGWAWMICLCGGVANFFVNGGMRSVGLIFLELTEYYQAEAGVVAMAVAFIAGGFAIFSAIGNAVGAMFSMRIACMIGAIFTFLGMFLTVFAPNIYFVIFSLGFLTGVGYGFLFGPSMVMVGIYFQKRRSLANGLAVGGGSIGQLILPVFIDAAFKKYTFQGAILLYSALILHAIPASLLLRSPAFYNPKPKPGANKLPAPPQTAVVATPAKEPPPRKESASSSSSEPRYMLRGSRVIELHGSVSSLHNHPMQEAVFTEPEQPQAPAKQPSCMFCRKLCDPELLSNVVFICFCFALSIGHGGYINNCLYLPAWVVELYQSKTKAAILISVMGVADLIGRIGGGWFSDLGLIRKPFIVGFSFVVAGAATIFIPFLPYFAVIVVYSIVLGLLAGTYMAQLVVIIAELFGLQKLPTGLGLSTLFMGLFIIPIPSLLGKVQQKTGSYKTSIRISGFLLLIGNTILYYSFAPKISCQKTSAAGRSGGKRRP